MAPRTSKSARFLQKRAAPLPYAPGKWRAVLLRFVADRENSARGRRNSHAGALPQHAEPPPLGLTVTQPLVLGPAVVPEITDLAEAEKETELAILSAVAHGNGPNGLAVVTAALTALWRLDQEHAAVYFQSIYDALREPMQRALEALVMERQTEGKATFPPFAQQLFDCGKTEGRAETRAGDVLTVLRVRGVAVPDAVRERILAEKDPVRLERWLERAILAASGAEVIDDPS
jgi:hypothetical protein